MNTLEGNKLIAEYMGYKFIEENVHYEGEVCACMDTFYSKVPIGIYEDDGCKFFKSYPNPDYNNPNPAKWNNEIKELDWMTLNYGQYITILEYHSSWDWLMPVVEKANKINQEMQRKVKRHDWDDGEDKDLDDATGWRAWSYRYIHLSTNISHVWNETVQFIQWYNQNKKP